MGSCLLSWEWGRNLITALTYTKDEFGITMPGLLCLLVFHSHGAHSKQRNETTQALLTGFLRRVAPASLLYNRSALNLLGDWATIAKNHLSKVALCCHITNLRALMLDPLSHTPWEVFSSRAVGIYNASLQCDVCRSLCGFLQDGANTYRGQAARDAV